MTHHPSFGAVLRWDPAGGTSYTAIAHVKDMTGPGISRGDIDVTDHDSANRYREFLPGLADGGEVGFALGWDPKNTAHAQTAGTGIIGDFEQDGCTLPAFQLEMDICGGTATWTWDGYFKGFNPSYAVEGQLTADCSIKVSGKPTLTVT